MIIKSSLVQICGVANCEGNDISEDKTQIEADEIIKEAEESAEKLLKTAENEYAQILRSAKNQAEEIQMAAINDSEKIKKEASDTGYEEGKSKGYDEGFDEGHRKGYDEGYSETREKAQKEIDDILSDINAVKEDTLRSKERMATDIEEDIVEMVYTIFEKIVRKVTEEDETLILSMVENNMKDLNADGEVTIITGKKDYEYLKLHEEEIIKKMDFSEGVVLKYDTEMKCGDCIIETPKGNIDISIAKQLKELKFFLKELLDSEE